MVAKLATSCVKSGSTHDCQHVCEIPKFCVSLAALLDQQPLFYGTGSFEKEIKVMPLEDGWIDARICNIFNRNAQKITNDKIGWSIDDFGSGNNQLFDCQGKSLGRGLTLSLYDKKPHCSLEILERAYEQVLEKLLTGWESARIEENPNLFHREDPNDFYLFIKDHHDVSFSEEDTLIRALAMKLSLIEALTCYNVWRNPDGFTCSGKTYLWVRKSSFADFIAKFGFKIEQQLAIPSEK